MLFRISSCVLAALTVLFCARGAHGEKFKLCVVDGKGGFKRSGRYCPILDKPDSKVECVLGVDRLDCLRRISKGKVDFSVFTPEDLVTATNSEIEVLITNELRYTKENYEYEVVAVVRDSAGINSKHDLKDKRFCHPGYGYETDWTRILSNYLEASVVPQSCQTQFTIIENRIKASSEFFKSACKAGPWVNNPNLDEQLKRKYPNLCSLCDNPISCATKDKYWGRRGTLYCLTDGAGDISWARLDDVRNHFGLVPGDSETSPKGYSFLCPEGSTKPINTTSPCVWVVKPWQVIATKRTSAQDIQKFISTLDHIDNFSWQSALLSLIETSHMTLTKVEPVDAIEGYLQRATGFLNANSFAGCHPPRTIRICTTSIIANSKCAWLRESSAVYGIVPDLECIKADNTTHCMQAINDNVADVVMVPPDLLREATVAYHLKTIFYETVNDDDKYLTVPVVRSNSTVTKIEEMRGLRACFPSYNGVAWNTVISTLQKKDLLNMCPYSTAMAEFFGPSCVPNLPQNASKSLRANCNNYVGDLGALKCLVLNKGDVTFVSKNSLINFVRNPIENRDDTIKMDDFRVLCGNKMQACHLSWAPAGYAMVRNSSTELWMNDTLDVFLQLDALFGRSYRSLTRPFDLYGIYNGKSNVLFHDSTVRLRNVPTERHFKFIERPYEDIVELECKASSGRVSMIGTLAVLPLLVIAVL